MQDQTFRLLVKNGLPLMGRAKHDMTLVRQTRGGRDYDATWRERRTGTGPCAELIANRFHLARQRYGLAGERTDPFDTTQFGPPPRSGDQLALL